MHSTGKFAILCLFALVFISPLMAEPLPDDESLFNEDSLHDTEAVTNDEALCEEDIPDDDSLVFEAPPLILEVPGFKIRSFHDIFPGLSQGQRLIVTSSRGLRNSFDKNGSPALLPHPDSGIDLISQVMLKKPSHIIEALVVLPFNRREPDFLDIYNALRKIKNIQDHTISIRGKDTKIFMDTTRLESAKKRKPVPDPPPVDILPYSETMYLRFIDQYMGDLYLRGDISMGLYGITYSLSNFRDVSYSIFRIMKAESFSAIIYLEPVKEGILVYSISGIYIPGFIARRVNLTPSMNNRITVLVNWIADGLKEEENIIRRGHLYRQ